jgi:hypothetical protein
LLQTLALFAAVLPDTQWHTPMGRADQLDLASVLMSFFLINILAGRH